MNNSPTQTPLPGGVPQLDLPTGPPAGLPAPPQGPPRDGDGLQAGPQAGLQAGQRLLRRQKDGRVIAGVCAGLARYLGLDPVLLRIAFVILTLANGIGILLYVIAAIVIPAELPGEPVGTARPADASLGRLLVGGAIVAAGGLLLLDQFTSIAGRVFWPLALAAIGLAILLKGVRR